MTATGRAGQASRETGHRPPVLGRPWLPRLAVLLAAAASLLGGALVAPAAGIPAGGTPGLRVPFPGQSSDLFGAAAGDYGSISGGVGVVVNQALHWDGTAWALVSTPDPGGLNNNDSNVLFAVRCATSARCLAVGDVSAGGGADQNQALFWNGTAWAAG